MANMSYCRFENTYSDLRDCVMHLELLTGGDATISQREWEYAKMMRSLCDDYLSLLDELEEQNAENFYEEEDEDEDDEYVQLVCPYCYDTDIIDSKNGLHRCLGCGNEF